MIPNSDDCAARVRRRATESAPPERPTARRRPGLSRDASSGRVAMGTRGGTGMMVNLAIPTTKTGDETPRDVYSTGYAGICDTPGGRIGHEDGCVPAETISGIEGFADPD